MLARPFPALPFLLSTNSYRDCTANSRTIRGATVVALYLGGMAKPKTEDKDRLDPVMIRMPPELHKAIKDKAAAEDRSMASEIRVALKQHVGLVATT